MKAFMNMQAKVSEEVGEEFVRVCAKRGCKVSQRIRELIMEEIKNERDNRAGRSVSAETSQNIRDSVGAGQGKKETEGTGTLERILGKTSTLES